MVVLEPVDTSVQVAGMLPQHGALYLLTSFIQHATSYYRGEHPIRTPLYIVAEKKMGYVQDEFGNVVGAAVAPVRT